MVRPVRNDSPEPMYDLWFSGRAVRVVVGQRSRTLALGFNGRGRDSWQLYEYSRASDNGHLTTTVTSLLRELLLF